MAKLIRVVLLAVALLLPGPGEAALAMEAAPDH
jgi:hypothetical protein